MTYESTITCINCFVTNDELFQCHKFFKTFFYNSYIEIENSGQCQVAIEIILTSRCDMKKEL